LKHSERRLPAYQPHGGIGLVRFGFAQRGAARRASGTVPSSSGTAVYVNFPKL
jgi:hypothetical protein